MKRSRFTEEQIIGILREHEAGAKAAELCRKHGMSEATLYNWKAKFGGMDVSDAKRLKALEEENAKLKKLLAESMLDASALRELLAKNGKARRSSAKPSRICGPALACRSGGPAPSWGRIGRMIRYRSRRPDDAALRGRLRELANARRRFGYRRLFVLLRREGEPPAATASTGFTARRGSRSASAGRADGRWARGRRSSWRRKPMPAGRWTLSTTSWPTAGASAS